MADAIKPRVRVPATAKKGDIIEIKTTVPHPMENGNRKDKDGTPIPRNIINKFTCTFNGKEVFKSDWYTSVSANPFLSFFVKVTEAGKFDFEWVDESGAKFTDSAAITIEG
ncbi:MAG: thiosulfate oxidation carrier complex protein SoxZ [Alphaproteobacteria bacterium]